MDKDLSKVPTVELADILDLALTKGDQEFINKVAVEITKRLYVKNDKVTMTAFLKQWGYKPIENYQKEIKDLKKFFKK